MTRRLLVFSLVFCFSYHFFSQINVTGSVVDVHHTGLEANLYVTDSTGGYISHFKTGPDGKFHLELAKRGRYGFYVSSMGYVSLDTLLYIVENQSPLSFVLHLKTENLDEVVIEINQYEKIYKGDTVKYNLKLLQDGSEKNLIDLMEKIPGLEVKGNDIKINGVSVEYLLINGKNLFDQNKKIALENIEAKDVKGIELYKNYKDPFSILTDDIPTGEWALNVKLDKNLNNKITGKITLTPGMKRKYFLHDKTYFFSNDRMYFSTFQFANTGQEAMDMNDYLNLMLQSGETTLELPPFLMDVHLQSSKVSRFGSLHFIEEFPRNSRIKAYIIFDSGNTWSSVENRRIFYDENLGVFRERLVNASFDRFLTGFVHWEKKRSDRLKSGLKFKYNRWDQSLSDHMIFSFSQYDQKNNRVSVSGVLQWKTDYRINPRAYLTYRLKLRQKKYTQNLQVDSLPVRHFIDQTKNIRLLEWSQFFTLKLKPESHHYLNISAGMSGQRFRYNLNVSQDTVRERSNLPYVFNKKITANYTFRYKHWLFSPGLNYEFVTFFNSSYPRFDQEFFYPSMQMSVYNRIASLQFSFNRRLIPVSYEYWERQSAFVNYNTYYVSRYNPQITGSFSFWRVSINSRRIYPGLYLYLSYNHTSEVNTAKNYLSFYRRFYIKNIIPGLLEQRQSIEFVSEKKFFKPGISLQFKFNHTSQKGFFYTSGMSIPLRSDISDYYMKMTYGRIKKPLKISVSADWKTTRQFLPDTEISLRNFLVESQVVYMQNKLELSFSFKYLYEQSLYAFRREFFFDMNFSVQLTSRLAFIIRSRDFFRLNHWRSTHVELRENYTYVQSVYRMPGYILAGFVYSY